MKNSLRFFLILAMTVCVFMFSANAQNKPKPNPKPKEEVVKPPQPDVSNTDPEKITDEIGFDTTAVPEDELTRSIRQLLDLTGILKSSSGLIKAMYDDEDMKKMLPEEFRTKFVAAYEKDGIAYKYLELLTIKAYRKYYTLNDVKDLIVFYQTPLGQKVSKVYPDLIKDSSLEGAKLGKWVATKIM